MRVPFNCYVKSRKLAEQPPDGILWMDEIPPILLRGKDKAHKTRRKLEQLRQRQAELPPVTFMTDLRYR